MITFGAPVIRTARPQDADAVWAILEPVIRDGETYALPQDMTREDALACWFSLPRSMAKSSERTICARTS
jgi:hypothetical protein